MSDVVSYMPPQNIEAEEAVLGAMLMSERAIEIVAEIGLRETDFNRPAHRLVFASILKLNQAGPVDQVSVVNDLKATSKLGEAGGAVFVLGLAERCPSAANARAYAAEVADQAINAGLVNTGNAIAQLGYEHPRNPSDMLAEAGSLVDALVDHRSASADLDTVTLAEMMDDWAQAARDRVAAGGVILGIPSGFTDIDHRLSGFQDERMYIIAARPGMGKSAYCGQIAEGIAFGTDSDVLNFNFEMGIDQQIARSVARVGRHNLRDVTNGRPDPDEFERILATTGKLAQFGHRIHFDRAADLTVEDIRMRSKRLQRRLQRNGRRIGAITIDYLQLIRPSFGTERETRAAQIGWITRNLKLLARELKCPLIVLAQLSRKVEERPSKRPLMSDLRESGSIEQDADVIQFLYRPEYYFGEDTPREWIGRCEVITAKWRDGQPGSDTLGFVGRSTRFTNESERDTFVAGTHTGLEVA